MRLTAPTTVIWVLAVVLGVIGVLIKLGIVTFGTLSVYSFELVLIGLILLVLGTMFKGL